MWRHLAKEGELLQFSDYILRLSPLQVADAKISVLEI